MGKTKIKICGLKRPEDIRIVNRLKPDFVGFVFAESKRKIDKNRRGNYMKHWIRIFRQSEFL